jgi:acyl-CoA dehydrogenase
MGPIVEHPDVKRMLATMKAMTQSARAVCYGTAAAIDRSRRAADPAERKRHAERASMLTPIAKAYSTDIGNEVASLGVQVHGGMGFIEETGAAQHTCATPASSRSTRAPTAFRPSTSSPASCRCPAARP